jgi:hypothetical protein
MTMLCITRRQNARGVVHPRPAHRQPVQRFLVDVLGRVRVRGEQHRHPQQRVTGLGDEAFESTGLLPVHVILSVVAVIPIDDTGRQHVERGCTGTLRESGSHG